MRYLSIVVCCLFLMANASYGESGVKVGSPAPDFELEGTDGKKHKLSSFKDKKAVVIAWYPKAKTGG